VELNRNKGKLDRKENTENRLTKEISYNFIFNLLCSVHLIV
jgi:hypothetical protein